MQQPSGRLVEENKGLSCETHLRHSPSLCAPCCVPLCVLSVNLSAAPTTPLQTATISTA